MTTQQICQWCRWWREFSPEQTARVTERPVRLGHCRARAPHVMQVQGQDGQPRERTLWPLTDHDAFCGAYSANAAARSIRAREEAAKRAQAAPAQPTTAPTAQVEPTPMSTM